jgi:DNA-nicking Smr family endonuclease
VLSGYHACMKSNHDPAGIDEESSFREAMSGVQPRAASDRVPPPRKLPPPRPISTEADERAVMDELLYGMLEPELIESGDTLSYRGDGLQDGVWRRLKRGAFRVRAELDLHGLNREVAYREVADFLSHCQSRDVRCVRIIHGKGNRSPNTGPVIKTLLDSWLRRRRDVLAFCSARPHDGGTGAVYVLLRAAAPQ